MTVSEIQGNLNARHREFPVTQSTVFLGHAGVCPLPWAVTEAMSQYALAAAHRDQEHVLAEGLLTQTRIEIARFIGAQPDEIAFVGPTSLALSFVAAGFPWRRGDNVLVYQDDYPANVYPWMALSDRGVEVRLMNIREPGRIRIQDVLGQVDENTRMVALASCHYVTGWRIDVEAIGRALRQRGILFCLDAIQTLGAFPLDASWVDFLAADAHKWMLGPCGAGILYIRRALMHRIQPIAHGWHNVHSPDFLTQDDLVYRPDARRFEPGTHNIIGIVGMRAGVRLLSEVGVDAIAADLLAKRAWLLPRLAGLGCRVFYADAPANHASGIVSFEWPGRDLALVHRRLTEAGVVVSLRALRGGRRVLRVSPHFYNTLGDLEVLVQVLEQAGQEALSAGESAPTQSP